MTVLVEWLRRLICATAWGMTPPPAYGVFHLVFFIGGFGLCAITAWKLRKLKDRGNRRLLLGIGIFLAVCELYKQLFYFFYIGSGSYQWWIFPFQLCSVPMYLCIITSLIRKGEVQRGMYNFLLMYNLLGGFIAFFEPSGLIHEYLTLTLHAFIWHMTLIFVGLYLGFSGRAGVGKKAYLAATAAYLCLCVIAFCINLTFYEVSGHDINMFFIGPKNSPIIVFEDIAKRFGWYVSTLLFIPCVCLGAGLIQLPFIALRKKNLIHNSELS